MSTSSTQTTLDDLPHTKRFKTSQQPKSKLTTEPIEEVDYSTTDFTEHLQEDIKAARKRERPPLEGSVHVKQEETEKFLKKAKISFLGQNVKAKTRSPSRVHIASQKVSAFKNKTGKEVVYTFRKTAQDTTTAQLTTSKGFKIGVLALVGGGIGGQGGLGVGAQYSRGTESMEQLSNASGREMQVQVNIPIGGSAKVFETDYSTVYDAECDFDIAIENSHKIEYFVGNAGPIEIEAADLKKGDDPDYTITTKKSWLKKLVTKHIPIVHLRRSCKCKLVSIEHDLEMELDSDSKSEGASTEDEGGDAPDTNPRDVQAIPTAL